MKKGIVVLLVFAVVAGSAFADFDILSFPPPVVPGSFMIDAGLGLRGFTGLKMTIPPLFLQAEYALPVGVPISVGAGLSVGQWKWEYSYWLLNYGYKVTYITPYLRANWHWGFDIPWLDLFTGISFGADIASVKWNDGQVYSGTNAVGHRFFASFQAGAHFYFSKNVGVVVETGYPYWLKAGLALKFGGSGSSTQASRSSRSSDEYMLVNVDTLNVRKGPSADTELAGTLKRDDRVQVLEKPGQWWKIKSGNIEGYVNSSFLKSE